MEPRLNYYKTAPEALKPMLDMEAYIKNCGLEHALVECSSRTSVEEIGETRPESESLLARVP